MGVSATDLRRYFISFLLCSMFFVNGCATLPLVEIITISRIEALGFFSLALGAAIMWYCWVEAKRKHRNPLAWLTLSFFFGFIPLAVLVYLKDSTPREDKIIKDSKFPVKGTPEKISEWEKEEDIEKLVEAKKCPDKQIQCLAEDALNRIVELIRKRLSAATWEPHRYHHRNRRSQKRDRMEAEKALKRIGTPGARKLLDRYHHMREIDQRKNGFAYFCSYCRGKVSQFNTSCPHCKHMLNPRGKL